MLRPKDKPSSLIVSDEGIYWPLSGDNGPVPAFIERLKQEHQHFKTQEENRLLYVALTRARQALFISGWGGTRTRKEEGSWYQLLHDGLISCDGVTGDAHTRLRLSSGQKSDIPSKSIAPLPKATSCPKWWMTPPPAERAPTRPLTPSDPGSQDSVLRFNQVARYKAILKGKYIHKLLEYLPLYPIAEHLSQARNIARNMRLINHPAAAFTIDEIEQFYRTVEQIITAEKYAPLFTPDARAEAPISGLCGTHIVQGQIDRLALLPDKVILADFKTGAPPESNNDIPPNYIRQMALYRHIMSQIYPDKQIICQLIWTQNAQVNQLKAADMDTAIAPILT